MRRREAHGLGHAILARLTARASVPVFPVIGAGGRDALIRLELDPRVRVVDTPRAATVLLLAGELTPPLVRPMFFVHDQISPPRGTVWWRPGATPRRVLDRLPGLRVAREDEDPAEVAVRTHAALLRGVQPSDPPVRSDVDPVPWRGVGPYGHGGKGMTGGAPYGRPMPSRAPDRDGLELDQLPIRVGPFFPAFPPGLILDLRLQGDVIQEASVGPNPFRGSDRRAGRAARHSLDLTGSEDIFAKALVEPVPVAALEFARSRHHLGSFSRALRVHGLVSLGERVLRLAVHLEDDPRGALEAINRLQKRLNRTGALRRATEGVGVIPSGRLEGRGAGPVARASGLPEDARSSHPAYRALGFEPLAWLNGDAAARWRQRVMEAIQSLELAISARDRRAEPTGRVEAPRGPIALEGGPDRPLLDVLPGLLAGQEWGDAITTVVSLDLDLEEAAHRSAGRASTEPAGGTP